MSANLSPEYHEADRRFREASTDEDRLEALRDMLTAIPKHKGTEKMQADIKSRIAKLRGKVLKGGGKKKRPDPSHVRREWAGQVVLVGAPNAGKSALVGAVTNADPEVANYPFTTQKPQPAMMPFENVQIQLVDAPAVSLDYTPPWLPNLVRLADVACLLADAGNDGCLENIEEVLGFLVERRVSLVQGPGEGVDRREKVARVPTLMVATKMDRPGSTDRVDILREFFGDQFEILTCSAAEGTGLDALRRRLFEYLKVVRVCTKEPGKAPETKQPYVLPVGSTVLDLAYRVHKDLARNMQYARIWGHGKFDGQRVPRDHVLQDMDILEIRA
ncbi:MAG: TGS domain-containing protein [Deltaproteobacteria bacterium]|nr:TGS domain-containing protein [Deltaproteobacteria bacterium]